MPEEATTMTPAELEDVVERACTKAAEDVVERMLVRFGMATEDPIELQKDFAFLRDWRGSVAQVKKASLVAVATAIATGVAGLIWLAIKGQSGGGH